MKRRLFLKHVCKTMIAGSLLNRGTSLAQFKTERPNILLIHTDQHRIDCLGAYGNVQIKTPHIDALAADGVLFKNSFCAYPVCTPSRYSLFTGLYVREHGGYTNHCTLRPELDTFPAMLKKSGYKTKAVGKMHFTPTYFDIGFEEMELAEQNGPGRFDDDYHRYLRDNDLVDHNDLEDQMRTYREQAPAHYFESCGSSVSNLSDKHHSTTWIGNRAVDSIEKWDTNRPNLLMVGFIKPHHPFDPSEKWAEMYGPKEMTLLPGWTDECFAHDVARNKGYFPNTELTESAVRQAMAYYYASITQIDHHVGRMIALLKKKKMYENTMIIFTSDHGEYLGFHHMLLKSNYLYDPLAKVPLIIKYPGNMNMGTIHEDLVSNIDLAPTILEAAGLKPAARMSGQNLADNTVNREVIISENDRNTVMARSSAMKLIIDTSLDNTAGGLLFDLKNDPLELNNVYGDPAFFDEQSQLMAAIQTWQASTIPQKLYLNQNAPQITQPNVPPLDLSHRKGMEDYFEKKMKSYINNKRRE